MKTQESQPLAANEGQSVSPFQQHEEKSESWMGSNIAPLLALATVITTFLLFWGFIMVLKSPPQEKRNLYSAQKHYKEALFKFKTIDSTRTKERQEALQQIESLREDLDYAKAELDDSKEQRGVIKDIILYILGVLSSTITTIFSYYFGSSKSSAKKDDTLNKISRKSTTA